MTGIRVRALNEIGQATIARIIGADTDRADWKQFFRENVENDDPFSIVIEHKNALARKTVSSEQLEEITRKQMRAQGAVFGYDYDIEVMK